MDMKLRIDRTLKPGRGSKQAGRDSYRSCTDFIEDLSLLERELGQTNCKRLAANLVTPLRREAEAFRFATVSLDIRENSTISTRTLQDIYRLLTGNKVVPAVNSGEWLQWLQSELARPLPESPDLSLLRGPSASLFGLFQLLTRIV